MSWAEKLLPASFRDLEFDVLSIEDQAHRALARHSYPYVDGADIEDMGRDERKTSVKAIFYGDDYEERLQAFVEALDVRGAGRLIHPIFGARDNMQVSSYRIEHDEEHPDYCAVKIEFEESVTGAPFFTRALASQAADAVDEAADDVDAASSAALAKECDSLVDQADDGAMDAMSRVSAMRRQAVTFLLTLNAEFHDVVTSVTDPIANVLGFVKDVTALTQSLVDEVPRQLEYLQNLGKGTSNAVSRLLQSTSSETMSMTLKMASSGAGSAAVANTAFDRVDKLLSATSLQPAVANENYAPGSFAAWVAAQSASAGNITAGGIPSSSLYPVPQAQREADTKALLVYVAATRAVVKSRIAAQFLAAEGIMPLAAPGQVEQIVTTVRAAINDAILQARDRYEVEQSRAITEPLKSLALAVQETGRTIINARPALLTRSVDSPAPLRLLAHLWYGQHTRALELQRLNNLRQPNAITAGDTLNAYAK